VPDHRPLTAALERAPRPALLRQVVFARSQAVVRCCSAPDWPPEACSLFRRAPDWNAAVTLPFPECRQQLQLQ